MDHLESLRYPRLNYGDSTVYKELAVEPLNTTLSTKTALTPGEAVVFQVVRLWLKNLDHQDEVAVGVEGEVWGKLPAKHLAERLRRELYVELSTKQVRTALNSLVLKGLLLRAQHASQRWDSSYFYRLAPSLRVVETDQPAATDLTDQPA